MRLLPRIPRPCHPPHSIKHTSPPFLYRQRLHQFLFGPPIQTLVEDCSNVVSVTSLMWSTLILSCIYFNIFCILSHQYNIHLCVITSEFWICVMVVDSEIGQSHGVGQDTMGGLRMVSVDLPMLAFICVAKLLQPPRLVLLLLRWTIDTTACLWVQNAQCTCYGTPELPSRFYRDSHAPFPGPGIPISSTHASYSDNGTSPRPPISYSPASSSSPWACSTSTSAHSRRAQTSG